MQTQRGAKFWIAVVTTTAIFIATPFILIPLTEGSDGFQDLVLFVSSVMIFGLGSIIAIAVAWAFTKSSQPQISQGIAAGLVAGIIGGLIACFVIVRLLLSWRSNPY